MYMWARNATRRIVPRSLKNAARRLVGRNHHQANEDPFVDIMQLPPMTRASTKVLGEPFEFVDRSDFLFLYDEIINKEIYRFSTSDPEPYIVDGGANIGLSVIYFKRLFPDAKIVAFEPDPDIFEALRRNCRAFDLKDVQLYQEALWTEASSIWFRKQGSLGGRLAVTDGTDRDLIVKTTRLRNSLDRRVALLKLDIEGAETEVIEDCGDLLKNVDNLFVEYHSFVDRDQSLHRLLAVVHKAGFRIHVHAYKPSPQPFFARQIREGVDRVDMNLDIFCYRQ